MGSAIPKSGGPRGCSIHKRITEVKSGFLLALILDKGFRKEVDSSI